MLNNKENMAAICKASFRVLVAEDDEINRILFEELLALYHIKADFALNGQEAVDKAANNSYDMIFMDINMPELDGVEATKIIRKYNTEIPIVAITANAMQSDKEMYKHVGMNHYIPKPIDEETLFEVLSLYTKKNQPQVENKVEKEEIPMKNRASEYCEVIELIEEIPLVEPKVEEATANTTEDAQKVDAIVDTLLVAKEKMHFSTEIIVKLLDVFLKSSYENVKGIVQAVGSQDIESIEMKAHAIRGGALALDLLNISTLCHALEYGKKESNTDYPSLAQELEQEIAYLYLHKEEVYEILQAA